MLLSLFSSVALAGLVAAGSIPHVARQGANTITCTTTITSGTLVMQSLRHRSSGHLVSWPAARSKYGLSVHPKHSLFKVAPLNSWGTRLEATLAVTMGQYSTQWRLCADDFQWQTPRARIRGVFFCCAWSNNGAIHQPRVLQHERRCIPAKPVLGTYASLLMSHYIKYISLDQEISLDLQNPNGPGYLSFLGNPSSVNDGTYYAADIVNSEATSQSLDLQ
jgi:hypothetical protein